nr:hypothetical protein BaRGS_005709 [Batillaria attramentaria]
MMDIKEDGGGDRAPAAEGAAAELKDEEQELLAKLEEANRMLELDDKACPSLAAVSPTPGHSRKGSGSSLVSTTSSNSQFSNQLSNDSEDVANSSEPLWEIWGRIVNDWDSYKKKTVYLRGMEMVFRVAVGILQTCQEDLLALDMEGLLKKDLRSRFELDIDQELLLQVAYQVRYSSKKMKNCNKLILANKK